jgi:hypothetical protein
MLHVDASYAIDCVKYQCGATSTPARIMEASISSGIEFVAMREFSAIKMRIK